jgi:hypothetical protein
VLVEGLGADVAAVGTGSTHTCALTVSGGVHCWGLNLAGQLGNGSAANSSKPVPVTGLESGVTAIATNGEHTCALTTNQRLMCWGQNDLAQLGVNPGYLPVDVAFAEIIVELSMSLYNDFTPELEGSTEGGLMEYAALVTNSGNQPLAESALTIIIPTATEFSVEGDQRYAAGLAATQEWDCADGAPAGTECTYTIGDLAPGAFVSIPFAVRVVEEVDIEEIQLEASATAEDPSGTPLAPVEQLLRGVIELLRLPTLQK